MKALIGASLALAMLLIGIETASAAGNDSQATATDHLDTVVYNDSSFTISGIFLRKVPLTDFELDSGDASELTLLALAPGLI